MYVVALDQQCYDSTMTTTVAVGAGSAVYTYTVPDDQGQAYRRINVYETTQDFLAWLNHASRPWSATRSFALSYTTSDAGEVFTRIQSTGGTFSVSGTDGAFVAWVGLQDTSATSVWQGTQYLTGAAAVDLLSVDKPRLGASDQGPGGMITATQGQPSTRGIIHWERLAYFQEQCKTMPLQSGGWFERYGSWQYRSIGDIRHSPSGHMHYSLSFDVGL